MPKKVLVTGAPGLLGREIFKAFERAGWDVVGTALTRTNPPAIVKLDLESEQAIIDVLNAVEPDIVVHSAANRFPDRCARDPPSAHRVNAAATATLAHETYLRSTFLLYISTDYVFPGRPGDAPYRTDAAPAPTNAYGRSKAAGERAVLRHTGGPADGNVEAGGEDGMSDGEGPVLGAVLRVPLLYGHLGGGLGDNGEGNNGGAGGVGEPDPSKSAVHALVDAVLEARGVQPAEGHARVKVDDYALRYPTCTEDVARVCVDVCTLYSVGVAAVSTAEPKQGDPHVPAAAIPSQSAKRLPRVLHFSSQQKYTKYEMCEVLADIMGLPTTGLERWDPRQDDVAEAGAAADAAAGPAVVRPYDTHLDVQVLSDLGVDVGCQDFVAWWQRELHTFNRRA